MAQWCHSLDTFMAENRGLQAWLTERWRYPMLNFCDTKPRVSTVTVVSYSPGPRMVGDLMIDKTVRGSESQLARLLL